MRSASIRLKGAGLQGLSIGDARNQFVAHYTYESGARTSILSACPIPTGQPTARLTQVDRFVRLHTVSTEDSLQGASLTKKARYSSVAFSSTSE